MTEPTEGAPPRFREDWRESATLDDGTAVTLRLIRADDKALLLDGFYRLSEASRYSRFLATKRTLSSAELRYLTECDGVNHLAIVATRPLPGGGEEGVGVARLIRLPDRPECAEAAITVVDAVQGRGLGRLLCDRLVAAAVERGIHTFRVMVLAGNDQARALIEEAAPSSLFRPPVDDDEDALTFELQLPAARSPADPPPSEAEPLWHEAWRLLLAIAARAYALTRSALPDLGDRER